MTGMMCLDLDRLTSVTCVTCGVAPCKLAVSANCLSELALVLLKSNLRSSCSNSTMRAATSLMQHMLRQHAEQMYRQPSLQANPLFSVLPHLLRSEVGYPASLSSPISTYGFATQAAQPQFKVNLVPQVTPVISSERTSSTRIQGPCSMTEQRRSQDLKCLSAGSDKHCLQ